MCYENPKKNMFLCERGRLKPDRTLHEDLTIIFNRFITYQSFSQVHRDSSVFDHNATC